MNCSDTDVTGFCDTLDHSNFLCKHFCTSLISFCSCVILLLFTFLSAKVQSFRFLCAGLTLAFPVMLYSMYLSNSSCPISRNFNRSCVCSGEGFHLHNGFFKPVFSVVASKSEASFVLVCFSLFFEGGAL